MKYLFYLIIGLLLFSCTKKDEPNQPPPGPEPIPSNRLHRVYRDGAIEKKYEYYDDYRLKEFKYYSEGVYDSGIDYEYIGDSTILNYYDSENAFMYSQKFYYVNDTLSKADVNTGGTYRDFYFIFFDGNQCGRIGGEIYDFYGELSTYGTIEYTDDNCSSIFTNYYANGNLYNIEISLHEDSPSPYTSVFLTDIYRVEVVKNIYQSRYYNSNNELGEVWSYDSEFEYNSIAYPKFENRHYLNGNNVLLEYEYFIE